jgi:hypothetical protein
MNLREDGPAAYSHLTRSGAPDLASGLTMPRAFACWEALVFCESLVFESSLKKGGATSSRPF